MLKALSALTDEEVEYCKKLVEHLKKLSEQNKINYRSFFKMLVQNHCLRAQLKSSGLFQFHTDAEPKDSFEFSVTHIDIEKTRKFLDTFKIKQPEHISVDGQCSPACLPVMK